MSAIIQLATPVADASPILPAGTNRGMLVFAASEDLTANVNFVSSVTYGGQLLIQLVTIKASSGGDDAIVAIWGANEAILAAAVGSAIVVTWDTVPADEPAPPVSAFYGNVDQQSFFRTVGSNSNIGTANIVALSLIPAKIGDLAAAVVLHGNTGSYVWDVGLTEHVDDSGASSQRSVAEQVVLADDTVTADATFTGTLARQAMALFVLHRGGERPSVVSANSVDENTVDVLFDRSMTQDFNFFTTSNYTIAGHTITAVSAPNLSTARLTLGQDMLNGTSLSVLVNASLQGATGDTMVLTALSAAFTGLGTGPSVLTVTTPTDNTVRITFDEGLTNNAALLAPSSYALTPIDLGAVPLVISSVTPEIATNPTFVDLNVNEMTDTLTYRAKIESAGILDAAGNAIDPTAPANDVTFIGSGTAPGVATAVVLSGNIIRINFDEPMRKDAILSSPMNYLFTPISAGAAQLFFSSISVPDIDNPTFVEIEVSEMTDAADYDVTVNGPTDLGLNPIGASDTASFVGEGVNPSVALVIAVSKNRVDVVFSEPMSNNVDINNPAKYAWDNGLITLDVLEVTSAGVVKLSTNDQVPGILYTLTITP